MQGKQLEKRPSSALCLSSQAVFDSNDRLLGPSPNHFTDFAAELLHLAWHKPMVVAQSFAITMAGMHCPLHEVHDKLQLVQISRYWFAPSREAVFCHYGSGLCRIVFIHTSRVRVHRSVLYPFHMIILVYGRPEIHPRWCCAADE